MGLRSQRRRDRRVGGGPAAQPPPGLRPAVARFMLGSLAAIARDRPRRLLRPARRRRSRGRAATPATASSAEGRLVEAAGCATASSAATGRAGRRSTTSSRARSSAGSIVRVKLWTKDGMILYSDEPALIGKRFGLGADERKLFATGGADAELSDLSKPENRYERPQGKLLEAHTTIRTPGRHPGAVRDLPALQLGRRQRDPPARRARAAADRRRSARAPALPGAARLVDGPPPAARPPPSASRCSRAPSRPPTQERRRIAADLHDGVVQDIAGVAFGLAPLAAEADRRGDAGRGRRPARARPRRCARACATCARCSSRSTRRTSSRPACEVALSDLLSPLAAAGIATSLDVEDSADGESPNDPLDLPRRARGDPQRPAPRRRGVGAGVRARVRRRTDAARRHRRRRGFAPAARERRGARGPPRPDAAGGHRRAGRRHARGALGAGRGHDGRRWSCRSDDPRPARRRPRRHPRRPRPADLGRSTTSSSSGRRRRRARPSSSARRLAPDVVLMDLDMPVLDGIEATRRSSPSTPAPRSSC